jgi:hypothetical protein
VEEGGRSSRTARPVHYSTAEARYQPISVEESRRMPGGVQRRPERRPMNSTRRRAVFPATGRPR